MFNHVCPLIKWGFLSSCALGHNTAYSNKSNLSESNICKTNDCKDKIEFFYECFEIISYSSKKHICDMVKMYRYICSIDSLK